MFVFDTLFHRQNGIIFKKGCNERFRKDVACAVRFYFNIIFVGIHTERDVGRKCPGRRCPSEEISVFLTLYAETHEYGSFLYVLIALRHFVRGKRRSATGAIRNDLMSFIEKTFLPDLFESPPNALDIFIVVCHVGIFHIRPVTDTFGHLFPFALIFPDALFALFDERLDTVFFDILLSVHTEQFFHFQFYGKSVRIPARLAQNVLALHRLITRHDIFHDTGKNMPDMRFAVRCRRTVIERKLLVSFVFFHALFENAVFFPELYDFLFPFDEIHRRVNLLVHCNITPYLLSLTKKPLRFRKNKETTKTY